MEVLRGDRDRRTQTASTVWLGLVLLVAVMAAGAWELSLDELTAWARWSSPAGSDSPRALLTAFEPLPMPAAAETALSSAHAHFAAGRVRDALVALDRVAIGDAHRDEADRLRAAIQRELLAVSEPPAPRTAAAARPPIE
jgi:hypothetical protein